MKIVYISFPSFADCDFPLIRAFQQLGHDVYFFMSISPYFKKKTIININKLIDKNDIIPARSYNELKVYENYLDFSKFFIINQTSGKQSSLSTQRLYRNLNKEIDKVNPEMIISTSLLDIATLPLIKYRQKLTFVVHDPFPHSGENSFRRSLFMRLSFLVGKRFILFNNKQVDEFCKKYKIKSGHIILNRLGTYDSMTALVDKRKSSIKVASKRILFFGRISPYKGIEYLCEAMKKVHKVVPDATLTIAGGGKIYFDYTQYQDFDYMQLVNRYIPTEELANLLQQCDFTVCPYTDATQSGVIMTSFTMNKPVVASNVGGLGEMIEDGITGILVPPKDVNALADAMIKLLTNEDQLKQMSEKIFNTYHSGEWDWNNIAMKYLN